MNKKNLRKTLLRKRSYYLASSNHKEKTKKISDYLYSLEEYKNADLIFTYLSMEEEIDTRSFIEHSLSLNKQIAVPVTLDKENMGAYLVKNLSELEVDSFGILSPDPEKAKLINPKDIDLAIVPLLAYNKHGYRLGYGRGYYDRYLPKLSAHCKKIGFAIKEQEVENLPVGIYDYPLDAILTPEGFVDLVERVETHCHSSGFSLDCSRSFSELLEEAAQKNYSILTLTDHYDKDVIEGRCYPGNTKPGSKPQKNEWIFPIDEYVDFCLQQKKDLKKNKSKVEFLMGIELGYQDYLIDDFNLMISKYPFDCVIGSIHTMDLYDFAVEGKPLYGQGKEKAYRSYLETLVEMVESGMDFDILAHFDYVTRYSGYKDPNIYYKDYPDIFDRLFKGIIERGICLEVNTRSRYRQFLSDGKDQGISDLNIYKRYYQLGGRMVSFATDAHSRGELHNFISDSINKLKEIGFSQGTYFKNRQAHFYDLF